MQRTINAINILNTRAPISRIILMTLFSGVDLVEKIMSIEKNDIENSPKHQKIRCS